MNSDSLRLGVFPGMLRGLSSVHENVLKHQVSSVNVLWNPARMGSLRASGGEDSTPSADKQENRPSGRPGV